MRVLPGIRRSYGRTRKGGWGINEWQRSETRKRPYPSVGRKPGKTERRPFYFERYASEGNMFIRRVAQELGTYDERKALRITRAVLHTLRDRLMPDDAVQFAQGLPMMLKAVYFDRYDISDTPVRIRGTNRFLAYIREKLGRTAAADLPDDKQTIHALQSVFFTLENHMDYGQLNQVKKMLPSEIVDLINAYPEVSAV